MIEKLVLMLFIVVPNALYINGLYAATDPGMILSDLDDRLRGCLPEKLYAPILGCNQCMASLHGILFSTVVGYGTDIWIGWLLVFYIPMLSAVVMILSKFD